MNTVETDRATEPETPLAGFARCHEGILMQLESFNNLPALVAAAQRARSVASQTLALFGNSVLEHHVEEEGDLFPAVLGSAVEGPEAEWVKTLAQRLTFEHRAIEALWKEIRPAVKAIAAGRTAELDKAVLHDLVGRYTAHARFEEQHFLPLAQQILGRNGNHLAALGIALHMRHLPQPVGYI